MSFEIYVQSFQSGEPGSVSRQCIRDAFGSHLTEQERDYWELRSDEFNVCHLCLDASDSDASAIHGFTVWRPCGDARLWDALASILTIGNLVLYFPGGRAPLVARSEVIQHMPPEMTESLGQPEVIETGRQILLAIEAA
jgi:hypothetical protein